MNFEKKSLPISTLLQDKHSPVANLYKKGLAIRKLDQNLKKTIELPLKIHFELININKDIAILLTNSSAWATRLRYNTPAILSALNEQLGKNPVKTVRIKIQKPDSNFNKKKKKNYLSKQTAKFLEDFAENFSDPDLRTCILKLSRNHN